MALLLVSTATALTLAEIGTRELTGDTLHWQVFRGLDERIEDMDKTELEPSVIRIGVFGDSFVDYYLDTPTSFVSVANALASSDGLPLRFFNFGYSGTTLDHYLANFCFSGCFS